MGQGDSGKIKGVFLNNNLLHITTNTNYPKPFIYGEGWSCVSLVSQTNWSVGISDLDGRWIISE